MMAASSQQALRQVHRQRAYHPSAGVLCPRQPFRVWAPEAAEVYVSAQQVPQQQQQQRQSHLAAHTRRQHICRATSAGPEKASVVELLWLLKARSDVDPEEIEVLLDALWSLQYMVPAGILCASAGPVVSCVAYNPTQQQSQAQPAEQQPSLPSSSQAAQQTSRQLDKGQWQCGFTHAVHFRLASRLQLEHLMAHPLMGSGRDQVDAVCNDHAQLVFEGMVTKRLEALFRRGEEFESGVEHVLLLQPGANGGLGADAFLSQLAELAESSVAGGIQTSHGAVISCVHAAATHVLMTRFAALQQVQQLLNTPACAAVVAADPRVPVVAVSCLSISIQPTEESKQVSGGGAMLGPQ